MDNCKEGSWWGESLWEGEKKRDKTYLCDINTRCEGIGRKEREDGSRRQIEGVATPVEKNPRGSPRSTRRYTVQLLPEVDCTAQHLAYPKVPGTGDTTPPPYTHIHLTLHTERYTPYTVVSVLFSIFQFYLRVLYTVVYYTRLYLGQLK